MKNWRVASWGRTELQIHPAVFIFLAYAWLTEHLPYAMVALLSIILHEAAHACSAFLFGQPFRSIELTPLGATLRMEDRQELSYTKRIIILVAGPMTSYCLCQMSLFLMKFSGVYHELCWLLFTANLSILIVNLLPAYPLDGGRLLALVLEYYLSKRTVLQIMRLIGTALGVFLVVLNLYTIWDIGGWNFSLALSGCCLLYSAHTEATTLALNELRGFLDRKIAFEKKRFMSLDFIAVLSNMKISEIVRKLPPHRMSMFVCIEPGSMKPLGLLTENEILQQYLKTPTSEVYEVLKMSQNPSFASKFDTM